MSKEKWKDIPSYEGLYQASTKGRIKSIKKYIKNCAKSKSFRKGQILKPYKNKQNYLIVILYKNNKRKTHLVSRLILTTFIKIPEQEEQCNHKNGIKTDNHIKNLEWCSAKENVHHAIKYLGFNNNKVKGERQGLSKLTEQKIIEIKYLLSQKKLTQKQIGKLYNISQGNIGKINTNKIWKHIK